MTRLLSRLLDALAPPDMLAHSRSRALRELLAKSADEQPPAVGGEAEESA